MDLIFLSLAGVIMSMHSSVIFRLETVAYLVLVVSANYARLIITKMRWKDDTWVVEESIRFRW